MTINSNDKLDLLWKHFKGVAPTSSGKSSSNERYTSNTPVFQKNIWTDSDRIPVPAPLQDEAIGTELWAEIVIPHKANNAIQMVVDPTTDNNAFHAMTDPTVGIFEENRIRNFVPATFDRSYSVRVWAGRPGDQLVNAQRLAPNADSYEWEFDYASGILFFPNGIPAIAKQNGIWIEAWSYVGELGREGVPGGVTSKIRTYTFTTGLLAANQSADFTFTTGGKVTLVTSKVTSPCTLECHAVSSRDDTNPYRFVAVPTHLVDDGSYSVAGMRYYGERFIQLLNMEDTASDLTYWRVINTDPAPRTITVIVQVA